MTDPVLVATPHGFLHCVRRQRVAVHRVGYRPDPWLWTPWTYVGADGRFHGRWDDPDGTWRTLYVGSSAVACYLEVLARFRPDPQLRAEMAEIVDDDGDLFPTAPAGHLPRSWCEPRLVASGWLSGFFVVPGHPESLPTLRRRFLAMARSVGLADLDGAAIRDSRPRTLTQAISAWIYTLRAGNGLPLTGIEFQSRQGDAPMLWTVYERGHAEAAPSEIRPRSFHAVTADDPDLLEATRLHHLSWAD